MQLLASLAAALCLVLVPTSEAAPAPSPQFPADLLVYAAIGKYILGTGVGIGKSSIFTIMDEGTIKTPDPKCRLYWCLIEFVDWRYSHSCWYSSL